MKDVIPPPKLSEADRIEGFMQATGGVGASGER